MRVIFMGTPAFAVPSLRALAEHAADYTIVAVVTRVDKPSGRGQQTLPSLVKALALELGLPVLQPGPLRRPETLAALGELAPDLIVVAAFGQILPQEVLDLPEHGCLNVHASLLPRHRGASPIAAAILEGDSETGVTIMRLDAGLDTGDILAERATPIGPEETTGELTARLAILGADLLLETLPGWLAGTLTPHPQDDSRATMTRLARKEDGRLDWTLPAPYLARQMRACAPWPGAYTLWEGQPVKLVQAHAIERTQPLPPGRIFIANGERTSGLAVACGEGALAVEMIQLPGKRAMPVAEALRGHPALASATFGA